MEKQDRFLERPSDNTSKLKNMLYFTNLTLKNRFLEAFYKTGIYTQLFNYRLKKQGILRQFKNSEIRAVLVKGLRGVKNH